MENSSCPSGPMSFNDGPIPCLVESSRRIEASAKILEMATHFFINCPQYAGCVSDSSAVEQVNGLVGPRRDAR